VAFVSKFGGAYVAARLVGEGHQSALTIGVCMNTRGLMELIVLNIGKDLGLLPTDIFSMLVIMALVSTFMATPLIRWLNEDRTEPGHAAGRAVRRTAGAVLVCDRSGGRRRILGAVTEPQAVRRLLATLGLAPEPPPGPVRAA
jgi:Kef-type K+ transport system membrane component KefB